MSINDKLAFINVTKIKVAKLMKVFGDTPSQRLVKPFQEFAKLESSGGIVLIISTILALILANSALSKIYHNIWQTKLTITLGQFTLTEPLLLWINDGLMALFFLVVGLEIKREILEGELSSFKHAALPVAAALGGMIFPAILYYAINAGEPSAHGWGIPMATDIAFSLGVLTLLGKKAPSALKAFVAALAIADDVGGVLVIALFYTSKISLDAVLFGLGVTAVLITLNRLSVRHPAPYIILGIFLWFAFLKSGIHATLAGVLLALLIPAHSKIRTKEFINKQQSLLKKLKPSIDKKALSHEDYQSTMKQLNGLNKHFEAPMHRLNRELLPLVTFLIIPIFAFANAGINIGSNFSNAISSPVVLGVVIGLVFGKQLGITLFAWIAVKTGFGSLPRNVSWTHIYGAAWLCGIGFTVAIFIANISFIDETLITQAKMGILFASLLAGAGGYLILRLTGKRSTNKSSIS